MLRLAEKKNLLIFGPNFLPKKTALLRSFLIFLTASLILAPLAPIMADDQVGQAPESPADGLENSPQSLASVASEETLFIDPTPRFGAETIREASATGAFSYEYPLPVPPGRAGAQPDLKLSYSSQAASFDGIFGYGWSISIPAIERINRRGVNKLYSENLFFSSLSGELKNISGSLYGDKDESGDFLRYEFIDNSWLVTDKTGKTRKFGPQAQSRQDDPDDASLVYKWMLEEEKDANGNTVKYQYYKNNNQIYPDEIIYTGNGDETGIFRVKFFREERVDYTESYKTGFRVGTAYRLSGVVASVEDEWTRKYEFSYTAGDNQTRSLLGSVVESGRDREGSVATLPATIFEYQTKERGWREDGNYKSPEAFLTFPAQRDSGSRLADVNGDSLVDFLYYPGALTSRKGDVWLNTGSGWRLDSDFHLPIALNIGGGAATQLLDVNGDQLVDIVHASADSGHPARTTWLGNGDGTWREAPEYILPEPFFYKREGPFEQYRDYGVRLADVNGDGLVDFLWYPDALTVKPGEVWLNTGAGWQLDESFSLPIPFNDRYGRVRLADVNGDGLVDVLYADYKDSAPGARPRSTWINNSDGTWKENTNYRAPEAFTMEVGGEIRDSGARLADVNGDGLTDFLWYPTQLTNKPGEVWLNTGSGWRLDSNFDLPIALNAGPGGVGMAVRWDDVDGDGLLDFLYANADLGDHPPAAWLSNGRLPDLLVKIKHNKGAQTAIEYKSSAGPDNPDLPFAIQTSKQVTTDDGLGNKNITSYQYSGGDFYYNNAFDRRFAGFAAVEKKESSGAVGKTYYHQGNETNSSQGEFGDHIAKAGRPYRSEVYDDNNNLYAKAINKWENFALGNERNFIVRSGSIDFTYDGDSSHRDKAESYFFDLANGNLLEKTSWGEVNGSDDGTFADAGEDKLATSFTYASDSSYLIGFPAAEATRDYQGRKISEIRHYYDNLALGLVSKGNLTLQEAWFDSNDSYIPVIRKEYDGYGLPTSQTNANSNTTLYQYDAHHLYPIEITNALGHKASKQYDLALGKATKTTDPNGYVEKMTYDGLGRVVKKEISSLVQSDNLVVKEEYSHFDDLLPTSVYKKEKLSSAADPVETYEYYDGFGRLLQSRSKSADGDSWNVRTLIYDPKGRVSKEYVPVARQSSNFEPTNQVDSEATRYQYDALDRAVKISTSLGDTNTVYDDWTKLITNANGQPIKYYNDVFGRLIRVDEFNSGQTYTTIYDYDPRGNLIKITDSEDNVRNFTYDSFGRQTVNELPHRPDSPAAAHKFIYDAIGNKLEQEYPDGHKISWTYDALNRVLTQDDSASEAVETFYVYDTAERGIGRLAEIKTDRYTVAYAYDLQGNIIKEQRIVAGALVKPVTSHSISGQIKYYDGVKAVPGAEVILEDGQGTQVNSVLTDAEGNYQFNDVPVGGDYLVKVSKEDATVAVSVVDIVKTVRHILAKEEFNSIYKKIAADTDGDGVILVTDVIKMVRRILRIENFPAGDWKFFNSDFALNETNYLSEGKARVYNSLNSDFTGQDFVGLKVGDVNNSWRGGALSPAPTPQKREPVYKDGSYATEYLYDDYGALTKITYPDGTIVQYDYNILGKIKSVSKNSVPIVSNITYGPHQKAESITYANGVKQTFTYDIDKQYRLAQKSAAVNGVKLQDLSYTYDPVGNITRLHDTGSALPKDANYIYDDLNRLTSATIDAGGTATSESYTYSPVGNILSKTGVGDYRYDDPRHPYASTQAGNDVYTYDVAGNLTAETRAGESIVYSYDYLNRLSSVTNNAGVSTYIYGPDTNRIQKRLPDGSRLSYLGEYAEITEKGEFTDYFFADSRRVATSDLNGLFYHIDDHLSSASILTDTSGSIAQKLDYLPFGSERINEKVGDFSTRFTFTDQEKDSESGLLYYGARYYNPQLGRFTQIDPITLLIGQPDAFKAKANRSLEFHLSTPQNLNTYSYVLNNPLLYIDPTGELFEGAGVVWNNTVVNMGTGAEYLYNNSPAWNVVMNNPWIPAAVGAAPLATYGAVAAAPEIAIGIRLGTLSQLPMIDRVNTVPDRGFDAIQKATGLTKSAAIQMIQSTGRSLIDVRNAGNINTISTIGDKAIRITTTSDVSKVISAGVIKPASWVARYVSSGAMKPISVIASIAQSVTRTITNLIR